MTIPSPPDWRGLCEELVRGLDENRHPEVRYPGHLRLVMASAREALSQPEPEVAGPTLDDIDEMCERRNFSYYYDDWGPSDQDSRTVLQSMMNEAIARSGRPALAQPEPEVVGPTDAELEALADQFWVENSVNFEAEHYAFARAVLARWGRPAPVPAGKVGVTDGELWEMYRGAGSFSPVEFARTAIAAALARYGRPAPAPAGEAD